MGTQIIGKGAEHIPHMKPDTRDNRDRVTTFLEEHELFVNSTNYQKPKNKNMRTEIKHTHNQYIN